MLPKPNRLTEERDFKRVVQSGQGFFVKESGIKYAPRRSRISLPSRVGIVVPKKITRTIARRNLIKRQVRHIFIELLARLKPGYDIVFLARPEFITMEFNRKRTQISSILEKLQLIDRGQPDSHEQIQKRSRGLG